MRLYTLLLKESNINEIKRLIKMFPHWYLQTESSKKLSWIMIEEMHTKLHKAGK
jgi:hypothetical protein